MNTFERKVSQGARDCGMDASERVLVGLSGGADSVALLLGLKSIGFDVVASHCNFGLRGDESERDERFCRQLCVRCGIELHVRKFDIPALRRDMGASIEMACREARYGWWRELLEHTGCSRIAVGHHREDNVETFFLNLFRGSGIAGLKGMPAKNGDVVRPLLNLSRAEIESWLTAKGETWVTDSTNLQSDFKRNRLRNEVLPMIERLMPGAIEGVEKSIGYLKDNYSLYRHYAGCLPAGDIDVCAIAAEYGDVAGAALFEILSPRGFNRTQTDAILRSALEEGDAQASGRVFESAKETLLLHHGVLSLYDKEDEVAEVVAGCPDDLPGFTLKLITAEEFGRIKPAGDALYLDASVLDDGVEWTVRSRREGDRLAPFGMNGTRLVSDIFSDARLSLAEKSRVPLLFHGDKLLWVVGMRTSRHYCVTKDTPVVACITWKDR